MAIRRLGISNPTLNTDTSVFTASNATYLCSVIITNKLKSATRSYFTASFEQANHFQFPDFVVKLFFVRSLSL